MSDIPTGPPEPPDDPPPPPPPPPPDDPTPPPPNASGVSSASRNARLVLAFVLVAAGVFIAAAGHSSKAAASGEVFLQPSGATGPDTFTPPIAAPAPPETTPDAIVKPQPSRSGRTVSASGNSPGLYVGQRGTASCDANALVKYLEGKPAVARPWAAALGVNASDIRAYVATLTPVLLRADTQVTQFLLSNGRAVPRQSVLQASTAVLIDRTGFPRVRCAGGNPLAEPSDVTRTPTFTGARWQGFAPTRILVVRPAPTGGVIVLVDVVTGDPFARVATSVVIIDVDRPAQGEQLLVVPQGGRARFTGQNWPPGIPVAVTFDDPPDNLGGDIPDGAGNVTVDVTIPRAAAIGAHTVTLANGDFSVPQNVYVVPPALRP